LVEFVDGHAKQEFEGAVLAQLTGVFAVAR
jgi:hypothetical protein